jgi:uncharacterized protein
MASASAPDRIEVTPAHAGPVERAERIVSIDVLRGVALLGILVMNIQSFSMPDAAYLNPSAYGDLTGANLIVWVVGHLLTDEKMYGLFSMLFGAGILLMAERAERRRARAGRLHVRRMGWLMLFGLLHGHLLWSGDILWTYGLAGLVAYLFRRRSPGTLVGCAVVFYALGSIVFASVGLLINHLSPAQFEDFARENWRPTAEMIRDEIAMFRGGWLGQEAARSGDSLFMETGIFLMLFGWKSVGNMLLGMALFKWRAVTAELPDRVYRRMALWGFGLGLPVVAWGIWRNFAAGWDAHYSFFFGSQFNYWGAIVVDIGWIGAIVLLYRAEWFAPAAARLAALGRTAFSNYIFQTLLCSAIFYGNGLGLFGAVTRVQQILIVAAIWLVQLVISPLWLRRFAFGPLEWLWRSLTYWQRIPFNAPRAA